MFSEILSHLHLHVCLTPTPLKQTSPTSSSSCCWSPWIHWMMICPLQPSISSLTICAPLLCFDCDWPVQMNRDGHSFACLNSITSANGVVEWTRSAIYQIGGSIQLPEVIISYVSLFRGYVCRSCLWSLWGVIFVFFRHMWVSEKQLQTVFFFTLIYKSVAFITFPCGLKY